MLPLTLRQLLWSNCAILVTASTTAVTEVLDEEWSNTFGALVNPLPRFFPGCVACDD
jgi:hypothetical protein